MSGNRARVIVLAAQRRGVVDPLAQRFRVSHKCLVPLHGKALVTHVVGTLSTHPAIASIAISVEADAFGDVAQALATLSAGADRIHNVPAADNIADSVIHAARGHDGPIIVTTADNVLLTHASVDAMLGALRGAQVGLAMTRRESVLAVRPDGQRRFYRFRCGAYSNCNLYGMAGPEALAAAELFRSGGQFAKKVSRIIDAFGLFNLVLLRLKAITLEQGLARISRRIGIKVAPVILDDGSQAIDVDNERTFAAAAGIMERRGTGLLQAA